MNEMRSERRNLCSDIVELFWNDRLGWPHRAKANLEDISTAGACVQTDAKIPVNSEIAMRLREAGFPGKVRYCTLVGGSYFVGVEFAEGSGWSPGNPDPKHILRLSVLEEDTAVMRAPRM
jgi:hypothetical protein